MLRERGTIHEDRVATPIVGRESFFLQLLTRLHRVRVRVIALVDGDKDRDFRGLGVVQGLDGLRHDAVVRRNDEDDEISDVRTTGAHGTERGVTGRVEERDLLDVFLPLRMRKGNRVSADVLRDAARFAIGDIGFADDIEQGSFAVVNMTHDGDDGRTRLESFRFVLNIHLDFFDERVNLTFTLGAFLNLELDAVLRADLNGELFVNRLIHVGEDARFHEVSDDLERLLLEGIGEFAHDNGRLDDDDLCVGRQRESRCCGLRRLRRAAWCAGAAILLCAGALTGEALTTGAALTGSATKLLCVATSQETRLTGCAGATCCRRGGFRSARFGRFGLRTGSKLDETNLLADLRLGRDDRLRRSDGRGRFNGRDV